MESKEYAILAYSRLGYPDVKTGNEALSEPMFVAVTHSNSPEQSLILWERWKADFFKANPNLNADTHFLPQLLEYKSKPI